MQQSELFAERAWRSVSDRLSLSARQEDICKCLLQGMSDQQIAGELDIAVGTVRTHLSRMYTKFGTQDRVETVVRIFDVFLDGCRESGCPRCT